MAIPYIHGMTDIETMGKKPGCIVLSMAVVPFYTEFKLEPFYCKIDLQSSIEAGFHEPDESTVKWWGELPPGVFEEATTGGIPVREAFQQLHDYIKALPGTPIIYGNGAGFDNEILKWAFDHLGIEVPWGHREDACYRTIARLFKDKVNYIKPTMSHSALADAIAQAQRCEKMFILLDEMFSEYETKTTETDVVRKLGSFTLPFVEDSNDVAAEPTSAYVNQDR